VLCCVICSCMYFDVLVSGGPIRGMSLGDRRGALSSFVGVVRACALRAREHCRGRCVVGFVTAWAGVCLKDAERGSYGG